MKVKRLLFAITSKMTVTMVVMILTAKYDMVDGNRPLSLSETITTGFERYKGNAAHFMWLLWTSIEIHYQ